MGVGPAGVWGDRTRLGQWWRDNAGSVRLRRVRERNFKGVIPRRIFDGAGKGGSMEPPTTISAQPVYTPLVCTILRPGGSSGGGGGSVGGQVPGQMREGGVG